MNFEFGKSYIVEVTEKGILPKEEYSGDISTNEDHTDLTDNEKALIINEAIDKLKAEIQELPTYLTEIRRTNSVVKRDLVEIDKIMQIIDKHKVGNEE